MLPNEARVFIIDDDARKLERLTEFVEANGGQVVGSVDTREDGQRVVEDSDFPASVCDANVVLIDGNLDKHGRHGTDGKYVFLDGYKHGKLHQVDSSEGLGAVAIACSLDDRSDVVYATGGNVGRLMHEEAASERWAELLEPHLADPLYLAEGVIERKSWDGGWRFNDMMDRVIDSNGEDAVNVTVLALSVEETKKQGQEEEVTYTDEIRLPLETNLKDFINQAGEWRGVEDGYIKVDTHTVKAVVHSGDYLYVIDYASQVVKNTWGSNLHSRAKTDKIAISGLSDLPDAYWKSRAIERPTL